MSIRLNLVKTIGQHFHECPGVIITNKFEACF